MLYYVAFQYVVILYGCYVGQIFLLEQPLISVGLLYKI